MTMNTTNFDLQLPERDRQPVICIEALLYPSEIAALKDKFTNDMALIDQYSSPAAREQFEGLAMILAALRRGFTGDSTTSLDKVGM